MNKTTGQTRAAARADQIIELIGDRAMSLMQIARMVKCLPDAARPSVNLLRQQKRLYISEFIEREGNPLRMYMAGNMPDAEIPPTRRYANSSVRASMLSALAAGDISANRLKVHDDLPSYYGGRVIAGLLQDNLIHIVSQHGKNRIYGLGPAPARAPKPARSPEEPKPAPRVILPPRDPLMSALFGK